MTSGRAVASILSVLIGLATIVLWVDSPHWPNPAIDVVLMVVSVGGASLAAYAWIADRRLLAVPGHIATLFVPWGFIYFGPLLAIILALAAGATFQQDRANPRGV